MGETHEIIRQVQRAKTDLEAADRLICAYIPFIKAETARFLQRAVMEDNDDEYGIAMIAFHEAIRGYAPDRGAFLSYAATVIRHRLIDYRRKETRHQNIISFEQKTGEDGATLAEVLTDGRSYSEEVVARDATRAEILELSQQMLAFGVSLTDVTEHCPKQQRTMEACQRALWVARENPGLMEEFLRTRRLPIQQLAEGSGVERKTLERHRKYMVAMLLIYTNGYELIRGHLKQVWRGGMAQ